MNATAAAPAMVTTPRTILVVDDEKDVCDMFEVRFRRQIKRKELAFMFAFNGKEALEMLKQHPETALVLTDLHMPNMDGLSLLEHLNANGIGFKGNAIVITAYGDDRRREEATKLGAFDILAKPVNFDDLEHIMTRAILNREKMMHRIESLESDYIKAQEELLKLRGKNTRLEQELTEAYSRIDTLETRLKELDKGDWTLNIQ